MLLLENERIEQKKKKNKKVKRKEKNEIEKENAEKERNRLDMIEKQKWEDERLYFVSYRYKYFL